MKSVEETIDFIRAAHEGQVDKAGEPYWFHPVTVMSLLGTATVEEKIVALLHDVVEDTHVTMGELEGMGYSKTVLDAVTLLTRDRKTDHFDYIKKIAASGNTIAIRVKLADLRHNMSKTRPISENMMHRYHKAQDILNFHRSK